MTGLPEIVSWLANFGIFTYYLPFFIVFAIFYAILVKTKIFGENKKVSGVISLIAALYVMTMGGALSYFFISLFTGASVIITGLLIFLLIAGLIVGPKAWEKFSEGKGLGGLIAIGIIIAVLLFYLAGGLEILGVAIPGLPRVPSEWNVDPNVLILVGMLIFTALVIWWMVSGGETKKFLKVPLES